MMRQRQYISSSSTRLQPFLLPPLLLWLIMVDPNFRYGHRNPNVLAFTTKKMYPSLWNTPVVHRLRLVPQRPWTGPIVQTSTMVMKMSTTPQLPLDDQNESDNSLQNTDGHQLNDELDRILMTPTAAAVKPTLTTPSRLRQAITFLEEHATAMQLSKSNWDNIFTTIEDLTAELAMEVVENENAATVRNDNKVEFPIQSTIRQDMTDMYQLLATLPVVNSITNTEPPPTTTTNDDNNGNDSSHHRNEKMEPTLRLFGAVSTTDPPAAYIHNKGDTTMISPQLFQEILNVPMSALTPSSSNTLLYVGIAVAILEGIASLYTGINYNLIVGCTLLFVLLDRIFLNGISMETIFKVISPELQQRIYHHEAGHFLCAYLLGCPIESIVVSAYAALQDPRFRYRPSFTAGTSFFDPILSQQMNSSTQSKATTTSGVTRSSIDRYSIIVMAGIAAEADQYGQADGGASDEYALIAFLSQLRSNQRQNSGIGSWNSEQIRNQARYGAVQAMLLLRQYRPAYEALVQALQYGGTLKDCIYAIEQAGRQHQLPTRNDRQPVGYIVNSNINDDESTWIPNTHNSTFIHSMLVRK